MAVARQQQVIAIVDGEIGCGIEIGAAAPAGLCVASWTCTLQFGIGEPDGGRQARNSGANDVDGLLHQMKA